MAGNLHECRAMWDKLQPLATQAIQQCRDSTSQAGPSQDHLDNLVLRFRSLRESLVSHDIMDQFAVEVYELSADLSLVSSHYPELLKCFQSLLNDLYSSVDRLLAKEAAAPGAAGGDKGRSPPPQAARSSRQAEMAASQLLFFCCIPSAPDKIDVLSVLRSEPLKRHWTTAHVQYAVGVARMIASGDYLSLLRLTGRPSTAPSPMLQALLSDDKNVDDEDDDDDEAQPQSLVVHAACEFILGVDRVSWPPPQPLTPKAPPDAWDDESAPSTSTPSTSGPEGSASSYVSPSCPSTNGVDGLPASVVFLEQALKDAAESGCRGATIALTSWEQCLQQGAQGNISFRTMKA
eukprot:gene22142-29205_t